MLEHPPHPAWVFHVDGGKHPVLGAHDLRQRLGPFNYRGNDLIRGTAVAKDDNILPLEAHVLSPTCRVEDITLESLGSRHVDFRWVHELSACGEQDARLMKEGLVATLVSNCQSPTVLFLHPPAFSHFDSERHLRKEIVFLRNPIQVRLDFLGGGQDT